MVYMVISACPQGTFKRGSNAGNQCASCPAHTHTTAEASTEVEQCICDEGYLGPAGGPCTGEKYIQSSVRVS